MAHTTEVTWRNPLDGMKHTIEFEGVAALRQAQEQFEDMVNRDKEDIYWFIDGVRFAEANTTKHRIKYYGG